MLNFKRMCGYLFVFLAVIQLFSYFLYSLTTEHLDYKLVVYPVYWICSFAEATAPLFAALGALLLSLLSNKRAYLFPILPVFARALYYLPDYYVYYISEGLDTAESILMSVIVTFLECTILYLYALALYLLAKFIYRRLEGKEKTEDIDAVYPPFALEHSFVKSVFSISFVHFCLQVVIEIIRTVSYLIENKGTYTIEEIFTVIISYVLHLCTLLCAHYLLMAYSRYAKKRYTVKNDGINKEVT